MWSLRDASTSRLPSRLLISLLILVATSTTTTASSPADEAANLPGDVLERPVVVKNGSTESVVLDCAYTLAGGDVLLHVKWFHIRWDYTLVFQWISGQPPQALGPLKERVNLSFVASETASERHRALQILRPTLELSGDYLCKVTSTSSDVSRRHKLIVYAPPRQMSLLQTQPRYGLVNITCIVRGTYPEPRVSLYRGANPRTMVPVEGIHKYVAWVDGLYNVVAYRLTRHEFLHRRTIFQCLAEIPQTKYRQTRQITYYPGDSATPSPPVISISGQLQGGIAKHQLDATTSEALMTTSSKYTLIATLLNVWCFIIVAEML